MIDHPFSRLLQKTQFSDAEKALIYAVMRLSTQDGWQLLSPDEVFDKMVAEFEEIKILANRNDVPEDTPDWPATRAVTPRIQ